MRSKLIITAIVIVSMLLLYSGIGFCQEKISGSEWAQIVEQMGNKGKINWSEGYIEATGIGTPPDRYIGKPQARPMALRAARVDAYRNLLETTKGVRVDSATAVRDYIVESDVINTQVEGLVKGAKVVNQEYLSDGTVEVTMRMPIPGDFTKIIIQRVIEKRPEVTPLAPPTAPAPAAVPVATAPPAPAPAAAPTPVAPVVYTGVVVDAKGLQARPAMSPKIIGEDGKEIYGSMNVERKYAVEQGMSGYARDLTAAQSNPRVTNPPPSNPVTVKGIRTEGPGKSDIVISNADAEKIRGASFLKECRVMIVLD